MHLWSSSENFRTSFLPWGSHPIFCSLMSVPQSGRWRFRVTSLICFHWWGVLHQTRICGLQRHDQWVPQRASWGTTILSVVPYYRIPWRHQQGISRCNVTVCILLLCFWKPQWRSRMPALSPAGKISWIYFWYDSSILIHPFSPLKIPYVGLACFQIQWPFFLQGWLV